MGGSGHFEPSPHASSGRSPGCCDGIVPPASARRFARCYGGPEGLDGRLATVGLRQPARSLPTIPTRFANSAAGRSGEDGAVTVALRMNDDQREGLAGGACLTVLDDGRGDGRKKR